MKKIYTSDIEKNVDSYLSKIDKEIINYFNLRINNKKDLPIFIKFLIKNNLFKSSDFFEFIQSRVNPQKLKNWNGYTFIHDLEDLNYLKGNSTRGKKRPEFAKKISKIMKEYSNNRTEEHSENIKKFHKERFKRKRLINLGVINDNQYRDLDEYEISIIYGKYMSEYLKGTEHKIKKIKKFINGGGKKYGNYFDGFVKKYEKKDFNNLSDCDIINIYSDMLSIISTCAYLNENNNMGNVKFFKSGTYDSMYCINRNGFIKYKSSYELETIKFLENNKIYFEYESDTFNLPKYNIRYTPDFKIFYKGDIFYLEIKGYIRDENHIEKILKQLRGMIEIGKNISYIRSSLTDLSQLKKLKLNEINRKNIL